MFICMYMYVRVNVCLCIHIYAYRCILMCMYVFGWMCVNFGHVYFVTDTDNVLCIFYLSPSLPPSNTFSLISRVLTHSLPLSISRSYTFQPFPFFPLSPNLSPSSTLVLTHSPLSSSPSPLLAILFAPGHLYLSKAYRTFRTHIETTADKQVTIILVSFVNP